MRFQTIEGETWAISGSSCRPPGAAKHPVCTTCLPVRAECALARQYAAGPAAAAGCPGLEVRREAAKKGRSSLPPGSQASYKGRPCASPPAIAASTCPNLDCTRLQTPCSFWPPAGGFSHHAHHGRQLLAKGGAGHNCNTSRVDVSWDASRLVVGRGFGGPGCHDGDVCVNLTPRFLAGQLFLCVLVRWHPRASIRPRCSTAGPAALGRAARGRCAQSAARCSLCTTHSSPRL